MQPQDSCVQQHVSKVCKLSDTIFIEVTELALTPLDRQTHLDGPASATVTLVTLIGAPLL
jgi:hypothetical protein